MTELKTFAAAIAANPDDDTAKLAFADWLDEHGDPDAAAGLRWCVRFGKWPGAFVGGWTWLRRGYDDKAPGVSKSRRRMPSVPCWLPEVVSREMSARHPSRSRSWLVAVRRLGWALRRVRELVDLDRP